MSADLHGFPFWVLTFDKDGKPAEGDEIDRFIEEVVAKGVSDLFIFSHGWNNDRTTALSLYDRFFEQVRKILDDPALPKGNPDKKVGVAGIVWPSVLWPDDAESALMKGVVAPTQEGGAASFADGAPVPLAETSPQEINAELKKGYEDERQRGLLDELTGLLEAQSNTEAALKQFQAGLAELLRSEATDTTVDSHRPDYAEGGIGDLDPNNWIELLDRLGTRAMSAQEAAGGGVGLGDRFHKLWAGAKDALRIATYWQMKQRAGIIGRDGLGAIVLQAIAQRAAAVRVHLIGHSFGARLVSFSLSGLPDVLAGDRSPVKSLFLLQGAFSHYAFADSLPHDRKRFGALRRMAARVDGPLLTTHSRKDLAVGVEYPAASLVAQDDSAALEDQFKRWGGMGNDGAQAVNADSATLEPPGFIYPFSTGKWLNLDGNQVIIHGGLPSGAHSDIVHPHTAWAALAAAKII